MAIKAFDVRTSVFVRASRAWADAVAANPFAFARTDPGHMVLMTLKAPPAAGAVQALRAAIKGRETVEVVGREACFTYRDDIGHSKLTPVVIERHLSGAATGRNWDTVLKIDEAMRGLG